MRKVDFDNPLDIKAFLYNEFHACGCSELDEIIDTIKHFLSWAKATPSDYEDVFPKQVGLYYIIAGICNDGDLVTHGSSIRFPIIQDDGESFLLALNKFSVDEIDVASGEAYDGMYYPE